MMNPIAENTFSPEEQAAAVQVVQIIRTIQLEEEFAMQLKAQLRDRYDAKVVHTRRPSAQWPRVALAAASLVAVLTVAILSVPSLRAIAQEIIDLITNADTDQVSSEGRLLNIQNFESLEEAEAQLGINIYVPTFIPSGMLNRRSINLQLADVSFSDDLSLVSLRYAFSASNYSQLSIYQLPVSTYETTHNEVGASASIEVVSFSFAGEQVSAQYVEGGYVNIDDLSEMETTGVVRSQGEWDNDTGEKRLIWRYEDRIFSMYTTENSVFAFTRDDLIRIAESME